MQICGEFLLVRALDHHNSLRVGLISLLIVNWLTLGNHLIHMHPLMICLQFSWLLELLMTAQGTFINRPILFMLSVTVISSILPQKDRTYTWAEHRLLVNVILINRHQISDVAGSLFSLMVEAGESANGHTLRLVNIRLFGSFTSRLDLRIRADLVADQLCFGSDMHIVG